MSPERPRLILPEKVTNKNFSYVSLVAPNDRRVEVVIIEFIIHIYKIYSIYNHPFPRSRVVIIFSVLRSVDHTVYDQSEMTNLTFHGATSKFLPVENIFHLSLLVLFGGQGRVTFGISDVEV